MLNELNTSWLEREVDVDRDCIVHRFYKYPRKRISSNKKSLKIQDTNIEKKKI